MTRLSHDPISGSGDQLRWYSHVPTAPVGVNNSWLVYQLKHLEPKCLSYIFIHFRKRQFTANDPLPKKIKLSSHPSASSSTIDSTVKEIIHLAPALTSKLQDSGHLSNFMDLLRLISSGKFPITNISFLLLLDVAKWYSLSSTSQMRYSDDPSFL